MAMRPLIIGNWKMHGTRARLPEARAIARGAARYPMVEVGIAPPITLLATMAESVPDLAIGGQDCHTGTRGAHTGDVSAVLLKDVGATFVIVGHSERRHDHSEGDSLVRAKAEAALGADLSVVVCVGETLKQRDSGRAAEVVIESLVNSLPQSNEPSANLVVAYEPRWAIGTGRVPSVENIGEIHRAIRTKLEETYGEAGADVRILYGGSVSAENAADLLGADEVGGLLVGGASLTADTFLPIVAAAGGEPVD